MRVPSVKAIDAGVPRLHQAAVELVERFLLGRHGRIAGHGSGSSSSWRAAATGLSGPAAPGRCRTCGVAAGLVDDGQQLFDVVAEGWLANMLSRAFIQLTLPRSVLISPLWHR